MEGSCQVFQQFLRHGPVELETVWFSNRPDCSDSVDGIDQVISFIIVILHVCIPCKFKGIRVFHLVTREDGIDILHDYILHEHNVVFAIMLGKFHKPGDIMVGGYFNHCIALQLLVFVTVLAYHLQSHVGLSGSHKGPDFLFHQQNRLNGSNYI